MRKKIWGFFKSRTFYIIFSILISVMLWIYVEYEVNPDATNSVDGIPIEFLNSELMADRHFVITAVSADTVGLRFIGRRNAVSQLNNANVKVTVDLAQITGVGQSALRYTEVYPEDINKKDFTVESRSDDYIVCSVENLVEKSVFVRGEYLGAIAMEGYQAEPLEFQPDMVTVYGPETLLSKVDRVIVSVPRENLTKTIIEDFPFTPVDKDGAPIDSEDLTFSDESVSVTVPIKMVRNIPLTVNLIYGAGATEENTVCTVTPPSITLSGEDADMQLNYVLLGTIDLTSFSASLTENFPIIISNELKNLTGSTDAAVTVKVTGLATRQLSVSNIQTVNEPDGYVSELITQSIDVTVRGAPDDLEQLQPSNIRVAVDLAELGNASGTHTVDARVYVDGDFGDIGAIGVYRASVSLYEAGSEPAAAGSED
jgi:YbbR domain-containing protein